MIIWIPGHVDLPEHDTVDVAVEQATTFLKIVSVLSFVTQELILRGSTVNKMITHTMVSFIRKFRVNDVIRVSE